MVVGVGGGTWEGLHAWMRGTWGQESGDGCVLDAAAHATCTGPATCGWWGGGVGKASALLLWARSLEAARLRSTKRLSAGMQQVAKPVRFLPLRAATAPAAGFEAVYHRVVPHELSHGPRAGKEEMMIWRKK